MKNKRFLAILMLVACMFSVVGAVYAADIQAEAGQTISYTVSLTEKAVLAGFKVYLDYDTSVFSLAEDEGEYLVEQGSFSTKGTMLGNVTATGCSVLWYHTNNVSATGTLFTITLKVAETAPSGTYPVVLRYEADDTVNVEEEAVAIKLDGPSIVLQGNDPSGDEPEAATVVTVEAASVLVGETVSVPVKIAGNEGFSGLTVEVDSAEGIVFTGAQKGALLEENETGTLTVNPDTSIVSWIDSEDTFGDGEVLILEFTVEDSCEAGEYEIELRLSDRLNFVNCNSEAISAAFKKGTLTVTDYILGDADDDGVITGADAVKMARHIVGYELLTGKRLKAADIDGDGKITSADCVKMARYLVGLIGSLN